MTAPVSLAAIKARKASLVSGLIGMTEAERDALVELACEAMTRRPIADTPAPQPPATDPQEGWTPLVPGCAMPERPMPVLVSVEVEDDDEPWAYTSSGAYWSAADCEVFTTDRDEAFYSTERFRIKRDRDEPAKRLTAWRPAPAPYRGGV